jgi:hypothetical protein
MIFVTTDESIPAFEGGSIAHAGVEFGKIPVKPDEDPRRPAAANSWDYQWRRP